MYTDEEMLRELRAIVAIPSVAGEDIRPGEPFGHGVAQALAYTLDLCHRLGMETVNRDGKTAWAEFGEGEELIAVIPHLDVVPAGDGWTVAPYDCTELDGRLYGRGVSDDKGPAIACIFAAADLIAEEVPLKRRVRLIFGQCEETGIWYDMQEYQKHEEMPVAGFTPDAQFPALCGEKGMLWLRLSIPMAESGLRCIVGGTACNMVASTCTAVVLDAGGEEVTVSAQGRAAHATVPQEGESAITKVMAELASQTDLNSPLVDFYQTYVGDDYSGHRLGIECSDVYSGHTTVCCGMLTTNADQISMTMDVRYPVTGDGDEILHRICSAAERFGLSVEILKNAKPLFHKRDNPVLVKTLEAYREETGDFGEPLVIGGGTYARALPHIVGFGPAFPGKPHTEHQKDEYISKEDFFALRRIYRSAIEKLANADME